MKNATQTAGQTANINKDAKTKFTPSHRKENNKFNEWAAIVKTESGFKVPVTLRTYYTSSGGSNTACVWISGEVAEGGGNYLNERYISTQGSGTAGGYGYHRPSAAAQEAINNASFTLSEPIDGRGDRAIEEAVRAIAVFFGYKSEDIYIHQANG